MPLPVTCTSSERPCPPTNGFFCSSASSRELSGALERSRSTGPPPGHPEIDDILVQRGDLDRIDGQQRHGGLAARAPGLRALCRAVDPLPTCRGLTRRGEPAALLACRPEHVVQQVERGPGERFHVGRAVAVAGLDGVGTLLAGDARSDNPTQACPGASPYRLPVGPVAPVSPMPQVDPSRCGCRAPAPGSALRWMRAAR